MTNACHTFVSLAAQALLGNAKRIDREWILILLFISHIFVVHDSTPIRQPITLFARSPANTRLHNRATMEAGPSGSANQSDALSASNMLSSSQDVTKTLRRITVNGEDVEFYVSEQPRVNVLLDGNVRDIERKTAEQTKAATDAFVSALHDLQAPLALREERTREFAAGYAWDVVAPASVESLVRELHLAHTSSRLLETRMSSVDRDGPPGAQSLKALQGVVPLKKMVLAHQENMQRALSTLFDEGEGAAEVTLIPVYHARIEDVLGYIRHALAKTEPLFSNWAGELDRLGRSKSESIAMEAFDDVERCCVKEIGVFESMMECEGKSRLEEVKAAGTRVQEYRSSSANAVSVAQKSLVAHREQIAARLANLKTDLVKVSDAVQQQTERDVVLDEAYRQSSERAIEQLNANSRRRKEVFKLLEELSAEAVTLNDDHERLTLERISSIAAHSRRKAELMSYTQGIQTLKDKFSTQQRLLQLASQFADEEDVFVSSSSRAMVDRPLESEANELLKVELLRHCDYYTAFQDHLSALVHKKESLIFAMNRSKRALDLQAAEAAITLDSNKPKYIAESQAMEGSIQKLSTQLAELTQRDAVQKLLWTPTEALLESEGIEYTPPTVVESKQKVGLMKQRVEEARSFVAKELEVVDKDALAWRKMKSGAQVTEEMYQQRMQTRSANSSSAAAGDGASPTSSQAATSPAATPVKGGGDHSTIVASSGVTPISPAVTGSDASPAPKGSSTT